MNQYQYYLRHKLLNENRKTRLANWPDSPPEPDDTIPIDSYRIQITPTHPENQLISGYHAGLTRDNTPSVSLVVPENLTSHAFKLLHHLIGAHDKLLPETTGNYGRGAVSIEHNNSPLRGEEFSHAILDLDKNVDALPTAIFKTSGKINNASDLVNHLSHNFSNIFLNYRNIS